MKQEQVVQIAYFLFRVVVGLLFLHHGGQKIFDWFGGARGGHPAMWSQPWIGGVIEFVGGLLVMVGLFTRPAAFLSSGTMAVAYFQFHHKNEQFWPIQNGGESAVLYCFIFLFIAAFGGGNWSLDAILFKKKAIVSEQA